MYLFSGKRIGTFGYFVLRYLTDYRYRRPKSHSLKYDKKNEHDK